MTLEQEIEKLREKHAKEEAELLRAGIIRKHLGQYEADGYAPPQVFFHKLFGTRGQVTFHWQRYQAISTGKSPDAALLRRLLTDFPPMPLLKYADGCTSFRLESVAEAEAEKAQTGGRSVDLYECGPVLAHLEPGHYSQTAEFEWTAMLDGEPWKFKIEFPLYRVNLGVLTLRYARYSDGEIKRVEECSFQPAADAQKIRWASGDIKTPNRFTLFWDRDTARTLDYGAFVK